MNAKISRLWDGVKYFCAKHEIKFYIGMVFSVFALIMLTAILPLLWSAILTPLVTVLLYFIGCLATTPIKKLIKNKDILQGSLATLCGCGWVMLIALI